MSNDLIKRLHDAAYAMRAAHESIFEQALSNGLFNSRREHIDCTLLNEAGRLASDQLIAEADEYLAQPVQEPVAWLHDSRPTAEAITDEVKKLLLRSAPKRVEHYTIPLYTAPQPDRTAELEAKLEEAKDFLREIRDHEIDELNVVDEVDKFLRDHKKSRRAGYKNKGDEFFRQADLARIVELEAWVKRLEAAIKKAAGMARSTAAYHGLIVTA